MLICKVTADNADGLSSIIIMSLFWKELSIFYLWKMGSLGVIDLGEKKTKLEAQEALICFLRTINKESIFRFYMP